MKVLHVVSIVVLILIALMNLGVVAGDASAAVIACGIAVAVVGLVGIVGLIRRTAWGAATALVAQALFLVTSVIGLIMGWDGSTVGIGVSLVALILTGVSESAILRARRA